MLPILVLIALWGGPSHAEEWRGLEVAPEDRCAPYERSDYRYPASVEDRIVERDGLTSPYGETFASTDESDIEHVVAVSEAHDSGLCAAPDSVKTAFARDLLNLVLASPGLNRWEKGAKDASEWMPAVNQCWFAETVVAVKRKYGLSVDAAERDALELVLEGCDTAIRRTSWGRVKREN